jgi:hypothetical protein
MPAEGWDDPTDEVPSGEGQADSPRVASIRAARDLAEGLFLVHDAMWKLAKLRIGVVALLLLLSAAVVAVVGGFVGAALVRW